MPETVSSFLYKEGRKQKYEGNILGNVVSWKDFHNLVFHSYFTTIVNFADSVKDFRCIISPYKCLLFSVLSKIVPSDISIRITPVWNAIKHHITSILAHKSLSLEHLLSLWRAHFLQSIISTIFPACSACKHFNQAKLIESLKLDHDRRSEIWIMSILRTIA